MRTEKLMHHRGARGAARRTVVALCVLTAAFPLLCHAGVLPPPTEVPDVFGIPVDFIIFATILLGVAVFHHHTLAVALTGLAALIAYKLVFTGFKTGMG